MPAPRFDHAPSRAPKQAQELQSYALTPLLMSQASTACYMYPPVLSGLEPMETYSYRDNNELWEDVLIMKRLRMGHRVTLESFFIFEWIPRSPGLYFKPEGRLAREEAAKSIVQIDDGVIVYDPYGKQSMLDGGVGTYRLKPIRLAQGEYIFVSASSVGVAHQGFPIAIPVEAYYPIFDELRHRGTVVRDITGVLCFVPDELEKLYQNYSQVPKMYLKVDSLNRPRHQKSRQLEELEISVAVTFRGEFEGRPGPYATYATFDPSKPNALKEAATWMSDYYARKLYNGVVLTDFDQHENHFKEATFSLNKVMTLTLSSDSLRDFGIGSVIHAQEVILAKYHISGGQQGAVGDNARNVNPAP